MKKAILAAAVIAIGAYGCSDNKKMADARPNSSVTDIAPQAPMTTAYQPAPQPVAAPMTGYEPSTPAASFGNSGSYTVKKGDTLYSIARQRYGDGKQWTKIASANPGVKPETLKVGQSIVVP